jgi:hypothetical protein
VNFRQGVKPTSWEEIGFSGWIDDENQPKYLGEAHLDGVRLWCSMRL